MFNNLSERLGGSLQKLRGQGRITEENVKKTLRDIRMALLEADVALVVVHKFIESVKQRAIGQEVLSSLTPGQALVKVVYDELVTIMGADEPLSLNVQPPAVILMAGLQGAGKTTSVAKLSRWLKERERKSVMVASADVYRPAAITQLQALANDVGVKFFLSNSDQLPVDIVKDAVAQAKLQFVDVLIIDTAGRLHVNDNMMDEIKQMHAAINPVETLFTVDSMTGQDAVNAAQAFNDALPLTGVILTKTDGDARGGAAFSISYVTGKPIKFMGVGEKTDALELFHPDRVVSRILGMGDILSLVEDVQRNVDCSVAERLSSKIKKGKGYNLIDFRDQLRQMEQIGGISAMLEKIPGMSNITVTAKQQSNDKELNKLEVIINSMTQKERKRPNIIKGSRKKRIAAGSGMHIQDVNRVLKYFTHMQKIMKQMSKNGGFANIMRGLGNKFPMGGGLPF